MTKFKVESDGSKITETKFQCKNLSCQHYDHMRSLLTSLTHSDPIKARMEFEDELQHIEYDINGNAVLLGSVYKDEFENYEWNFVQCRKCQYKHIVENSYNSLVDEPTETVFSLFK